VGSTSSLDIGNRAPCNDTEISADARRHGRSHRLARPIVLILFVAGILPKNHSPHNNRPIIGHWLRTQGHTMVDAIWGSGTL
jgi:hypothetical protein